MLHQGPRLKNPSVYSYGFFEHLRSNNHRQGLTVKTPERFLSDHLKERCRGKMVCLLKSNHFDSMGKPMNGALHHVTRASDLGFRPTAAIAISSDQSSCSRMPDSAPTYADDISSTTLGLGLLGTEKSSPNNIQRKNITFVERSTINRNKVSPNIVR